MPEDHSRRQRALRAYNLLLRLYPREFRQRFGDDMAEMFAELLEEESRHGSSWRVWQRVILELFPTLLREHACSLSRGIVKPHWKGWLGKVFRVGLAGAIPLAGYVYLLTHAERPGDAAILTLWFVAVAAGVLRGRGRGWRSMAGASGAAAAVAVLVLTGSALWSTMNPGPLSLAPLFITLSAMAAFIVSTYVRLIIEGVQLRPRPLALRT